ncbi:MAG: four helix bundle protein [bacterium]|nr:four helix bundle protein [bacterium]
MSYKLWHEYIVTFSKTSRYTLGETIDKYFLQTIENILIASFLQIREKQPFIKKAIVSLDALKFFLFMAWETETIDDKKYIALSEPLSLAGKMLGGWYGQIVKQNSPESANGRTGEK